MDNGVKTMSDLMKLSADDLVGFGLTPKTAAKLKQVAEHYFKEQE